MKKPQNPNGPRLSRAGRLRGSSAGRACCERPPPRSTKRSTKWTSSAPSAEGTDSVWADAALAESRDGAATAASELVQQVRENVDPFRQARVFVGSSSQKLGVNLLVGFEGYVVFDVIAGLKNKSKTENKT